MKGRSLKHCLPLKEGAIFDLEYTVRSPFYSRLRPWAFQGEYPCLWSEYTVTIAPPFHYVMSLQGDTSFGYQYNPGNSQYLLYSGRKGWRADGPI